MANTKAKASPETENVEDVAAVEEEQTKPVKRTPTEVDPHQFISVKNGFQGRLVYVSKRTGEKYVWDEFGDEQDVELQELKNAKNSAKKFFINNWFLFNEGWVIDYLGVKQYYRHALGIDDFDSVFSMKPDEILETVSNLSPGQKRSVAYRARTLIAEGQIDSNKAISALEQALGVDLVEK